MIEEHGLITLPRPLRKRRKCKSEHGHLFTALSSRISSTPVSSTDAQEVTPKACSEKPVRPHQAWPNCFTFCPFNDSSFQYPSACIQPCPPTSNFIAFGQSNCGCFDQSITSAYYGGESTILYAEYGYTGRSGLNAKSSTNQVRCSFFEK